MLDSGWWLAAAVVAGVVLFAVYHHAEYRHSPYREGWYRHAAETWLVDEPSLRSIARARSAAPCSQVSRTVSGATSDNLRSAQARPPANTTIRRWKTESGFLSLMAHPALEPCGAGATCLASQIRLRTVHLDCARTVAPPTSGRRNTGDLALTGRRALLVQGEHPFRRVADG